MAVSLSVLVAAVRASVPSAAAVPDADVASAVRTARTPAGAVWLARRAWPAAPVADTAKDTGRWATILRCLRPMADAGDPMAADVLALLRGAGADAPAALAAALGQVAADA